jgi:hypothetical protein
VCVCLCEPQFSQPLTVEPHHRVAAGKWGSNLADWEMTPLSSSRQMGATVCAATTSAVGSSEAGFVCGEHCFCEKVQVNLCFIHAALEPLYTSSGVRKREPWRHMLNGFIVWALMSSVVLFIITNVRIYQITIGPLVATRSSSSKMELNKRLKSCRNNFSSLQSSNELLYVSASLGVAG